jgi:hypothetical protein
MVGKNDRGGGKIYKWLGRMIAADGRYTSSLKERGKVRLCVYEIRIAENCKGGNT